MNEKKILGPSDIRKLIPHRYPILLLDTVSEYETGQYALGHKAVTQTEPFLQGHFPDEPIMPGVLQIESIAQLFAVLTGLEEQGRMLLAGVSNARFYAPVLPGMVMDIRVEVSARKMNVLKGTGVVTVGGKKMSEATITGALT